MLTRAARCVWMQEVPFYYRGPSNGAATLWGRSAGQSYPRYLLVEHELRTPWMSVTTGQFWDLPKAGRAADPSLSNQVSKVYASTSYGASAWLKNFNSAYPDTGFIRIWDEGSDYTSRAYLEDLITILGLNKGDVKYPDLVARYHMDGGLDRGIRERL